MTKSKIFISYSHHDELIKNKLVKHLSILKNHSDIEIFDTNSILPGKEWHKEIQENIADSDILILLISPDFLASDYIYKEELPAIVKMHKKTGQVVIPVLARSTMWTLSPELMQFQVWPQNAKALSGLSAAEIENKLAELSKEIANIVVAKEKEKTHTDIKDQPTDKKHKRKPHHFFVSHDHSDGDFAELMTLRLEKLGYNSWTDIERLPIGQDWKIEIDNSIKKANALIVVMTPEARQSEYVTYEWAFALGHGTPVIPLLLKQTSIHPRLSSLQYLDFTNRLGRPWEKLISTLDEYIK